MPLFGKKAGRAFGSFAKKLGVKQNFGRKLVHTLGKVGNVVGRVADVASVLVPGLAPLAMGVKAISSQAAPLAKTAIGLTGKTPDFGALKEQVGAVKKGVKQIQEARSSLQKKKPAPSEEDSGIQFSD